MEKRNPNTRGAAPAPQVRRPRPRTLGERIAKFLAMPTLARHQRNERIAIAVIVVIAVVYFVLQPLVATFFSSAPRQSSSPAAAGPSATPQQTRPDKHGP